MEHDDADEDMPLVMDIGSSKFLAGWAGNNSPHVCFPSAIGSSRLSTKYQDTDRVGNDMEGARDLMSLRYPIQRGIVTDWDDMEKLMAHCYKELKVKSSDHRVLISETPLNPRSNQEKLAQMMFEKFDIPAIYLEQPADLLALECFGRHTAVILNVGHGVTFASPLYEGFCFTDGIQRQDFAGSDVTNYLQKCLMERGHSFTTSLELEMVRALKEKKCFVALNYNEEISRRSNKEKNSNSFESQSYTTPDGCDMELSDELFKCTEILFRPRDFGFQGLLGIQEMVFNAIEAAPKETRRGMMIGINLTGGARCIPGIKERLLKEIEQKYSETHNRLRVTVHPFNRNPNQNYEPTNDPIDVWFGGAIVGSLSITQPRFLSKQQYEEIGPSILYTGGDRGWKSGER